MLVYGHRGAAGVAPENSLEGLRAALALGAHGVEFDVRGTADGVPVLLHDRSLDRTTTGRGDIDELSIADVRKAEAGDSAPVPTLDEAVTLLGGRTHLNVELKRSGIEREVLRSLAPAPREGWAISSLDWEALGRLRSLDPTATLWPVARVVDDALFAVAAELASPAIALRADAYTDDVARRCAETGLGVLVWTVNDANEARRVRALGADALCTDVPATMKQALDGPVGTPDVGLVGSERRPQRAVGGWPGTRPIWITSCASGDDRQSADGGTVSSLNRRERTEDRR